MRFTIAITHQWEPRLIAPKAEIGIVEYKLFDLAIESIYQAYKGSHYSLFVDIFQVVL